MTCRTRSDTVVQSIALEAQKSGGRALVVGGWVRDTYLRLPNADVDIEVYGIGIDALEQILFRLDLEFDAIGRSFGILKLKDYDVDVSIPRRENRIGVHHKSFKCEFDLALTPEVAALRRDFTMNSMYYDPLTGEVDDPHNGRADLEAGMLRMTNVDKFGEDPLRVLRAMQFIARFGLAPDCDLIGECRKLPSQWSTISKERVFEEWRKMLLKGKYIGQALRFLVTCRWIGHFPELESLINLPQEPEWHPEGDTFAHICHCMDAFSRLDICRPSDATSDEEFGRLVVGFGVLCHDMGKPATTECNPADGVIRSIKHDRVGVEVTERFMRRLTDWEDLIEAVKSMTAEHMFTAGFSKQRMTARGVRRLSRRCPSIDLLCHVIQCDKEGRPPIEADLSDVVELRKLALQHGVYHDPPPPIMMGRHLIEMGLEPGTRFGEILEACQVAEDDGRITDVESGKAFVITLLG